MSNFDSNHLNTHSNNVEDDNTSTVYPESTISAKPLIDSNHYNSSNNYYDFIELNETQR